MEDSKKRREKRLKDKAKFAKRRRQDAFRTSKNRAKGSENRRPRKRYTVDDLAEDSDEEDGVEEYYDEDN